jgi:hypothetical protein
MKKETPSSLDTLRSTFTALGDALERFPDCFDVASTPMALAILALLDDAISRREEDLAAADPRHIQ